MVTPYIAPVETPSGDPESVDVVTLIDSTEPLGILAIERPDNVIVNCTDPVMEPAATVSNIALIAGLGAAADITTAASVITTGATEAKNPGGNASVMTPPVGSNADGVNLTTALACLFPTKHCLSGKENAIDVTVPPSTEFIQNNEHNCIKMHAISIWIL
jgi:hypothetical protein